VGPYAPEKFNGGDQTYTLDYKQHTSATQLDGWVAVWWNGVKVIDVRWANIGVIPSGGEKAWCTENMVRLISTADAGVASQYGLAFGGARSTNTGPAFTFEIWAASVSLTTD
jgi:hypothetical protein